VLEGAYEVNAMANSEVDINQLSESQQQALEQYTAVTNQEVEAAIPLLQRSQWNLQVFY
jgi:FAS-associated factor 2